MNNFQSIEDYKSYYNSIETKEKACKYLESKGLTGLDPDDVEDYYSTSYSPRAYIGKALENPELYHFNHEEYIESFHENIKLFISEAKRILKNK